MSWNCPLKNMGLDLQRGVASQMLVSPQMSPNVEILGSFSPFLLEWNSPLYREMVIHLSPSNSWISSSLVQKQRINICVQHSLAKDISNRVSVLWAGASQVLLEHYSIESWKWGVTWWAFCVSEKLVWTGTYSASDARLDLSFALQTNQVKKSHLEIKTWV